MNREIKFRAWDGDKKVMHLPEYTDRSDFHIQADGTIVETHEYGYERHELTNARPDSWILMQFTGLHDKNGKEIYEGDVYTWDYEYDADYDGDMPIVKRSDGRDYVRNIFDTIRIGMAAREGKRVEIIGNVFEHPELTSQTK